MTEWPINHQLLNRFDIDPAHDPLAGPEVPEVPKGDPIEIHGLARRVKGNLAGLSNGPESSIQWAFSFDVNVVARAFRAIPPKSPRPFG